MSDTNPDPRTEWIKPENGTLRWKGPHWSTLSEGDKEWVRQYLRSFGPLGEQLLNGLEADYGHGPS